MVTWQDEKADLFIKMCEHVRIEVARTNGVDKDADEKLYADFSQMLQTYLNTNMKCSVLVRDDRRVKELAEAERTFLARIDHLFRRRKSAVQGIIDEFPRLAEGWKRAHHEMLSELRKHLE